MSDEHEHAYSELVQEIHKRGEELLTGARRKSTTIAPNRRWFRFSLRMLFVVVTILGCWLGRNVYIVRERADFRDQVRSHGGFVEPSVERLNRQNEAPYQVPSLPFLRQWVGDQAIFRVSVPSDMNRDGLDRAKQLFPEADVVEFVRHGTGIM